MFGFGSDLASGRTKRESTSPLSLCYVLGLVLLPRRITVGVENFDCNLNLLFYERAIKTSFARIFVTLENAILDLYCMM